MAITGPKGARGEVADRILQTARIAFARDGYAGTSLQGIAREAGVDTKLVRYYYSGKEALLEACIETPASLIEGVAAAGEVPIEERGPSIVRAMLRGWADPSLALVLRTSLLIAAHEPLAMQRVRSVFVEGLIPALGLDRADPDTAARGGLVSSQLLGLAFARFVFAIDQAAQIPDDVIIRQVGATVQRYLTDPIR